jgi:TctA family transporter
MVRGSCATREHLLSMIGTDPQSGTLRWTMDSLYLWEGMPLVPVTLGIFALPELRDLAIGRTPIVEAGKTLDTKTGMLLGVKDCFTHWFLILRCSWLGAALGAIPGIGVSVIDWIAPPRSHLASLDARDPPSPGPPGEGGTEQAAGAESTSSKRAQSSGSTLTIDPPWLLPIHRWPGLLRSST